MHGIGDCLRHRWYRFIKPILGSGLNSHQSFDQWLKLLANLTNYLPQRSCTTLMFLHMSVILFTTGEGWVSVPACTTGYMTRGIPVGDGLFPEGLCLGGSVWGSLSRGESLCRGSLSWEGGWGFCPGRSLSERHPLYSNKREVHILLECIHVRQLYSR